jgi:hypothetical protein
MNRNEQLIFLIKWFLSLGKEKQREQDLLVKAIHKQMKEDIQNEL